MLMSDGQPGSIVSRKPVLAATVATEELISDLRGGKTSIEMIDAKLFALLKCGESIDTAQFHLRVSARGCSGKPR